MNTTVLLKWRNTSFGDNLLPPVGYLVHGVTAHTIRGKTLVCVILLLSMALLNEI